MTEETDGSVTGVIRIPHCLELVINGSTQNQTWANVLHYTTTPDVGSPSDLAGIATEFNVNVIPHYLGLMSNQSQIDSLHLRTIYPSPAINYEYDLPFTPPQHGSSSADQVPENSTPVISWRSGAVGRSFRGRSYTAGMPEDQVSGSTLIPGYVSILGALAAAIGSFIGDPGGIHTTFGVASRKLLQMIPIITAIVDLTSKSQRDRLPFERRHKKKRV